MKLYLIIQSMDAGGAQRVLSNLANHWSRLGHDIVLATFTNAESFYDLDREIKHLKLGLDSKSIKEKKVFFNNIFRINSIKRSIESEEVDVIISFMTNANVLSTISSKLTNVPILISERTNHKSLRSKIWRVLRRLFYPFSDALIVQSHYDKEKYSFHKNCTIIHNPLYVSNQFGDIKKENIILAVGRLEYLKGFDMLIEALSYINLKGWRVIILGEGDYRQKLEEQIFKNGLDSFVEMAGNRQDIEKYYKRASIFVLSSRVEGFPNVLIEAMSYGCASIAFDCLTGPRDIIDDKKNGLLIKEESIDELSSAIEYLIDNPTEIDRISHSGKDINNKLAIEKISDKWLSIISDLIKK